MLLAKETFCLNLKHQWIISAHHGEESPKPSLLVLHPSSKPAQKCTKLFLQYARLPNQRRCTVGTGQSSASGVTMSAWNFKGLL